MTKKTIASIEEHEVNNIETFDDGTAPMHHIDRAGGIMAHVSPYEGGVKFNLLQDFPLHNTDVGNDTFLIKSRVVCRISMTPAAFVEMSEWFSKVAENLKERMKSEE